MGKEMAVMMRGVTKRFGSVIANDHVDLDVREGEILAVLGENGSGKTTLMNMLSGIYFPDEGQVSIHGKNVTIRDPRDAYELGIGMIHQHFKLVDVFTAAENIILGLPGSARLDMKQVAGKIRELCERYGFELDPNQKIYDMSVSQKQTVEILKVLYRGADILILDEPTAVLTPQETERLFAILRNMRADGKAILIITHKLAEVLAISDRVAVLRKGQSVGTVETKTATVESLTELMVGKKVTLDIERPEVADKEPRLVVENLTCVNEEGVTTLDHATFTAMSGEILGVAGVAGSGQKELLEAIAGLQPKTEGLTYYYPSEDGAPINTTSMTAGDIRRLGVHLAFVPEDRLGMGLVGSMGMTDNMMLRTYQDGHGFFTDKRGPRKVARELLEQLEIVTPGIDTPVRRMSGGNVQKVLVGREISTAPSVLMVAYPVRGLDINSSYTIYGLLNEQKKRGTSIICVGEDLDVLLSLCDRIMVLCGGRITGIVDARTATKEEIGRLMTHTADMPAKEAKKA